jgi:hypothetical protein
MHPSLACLIRHSNLPTEETKEHFRFQCPARLAIWSSVYYSYLSPTGPSSILLSCLHQQMILSLPDSFQRVPPITMILRLSCHQILAYALQVYGLLIGV